VPNLLRNVLAVVIGFVIGSAVNMMIVLVSPTVIPPPAGVDMKTPDGLASGMHLLEPKHFVMPFLAHALGTFAGALAAYLIAASHKARFAWAIGLLFLLGGVAASFMVPAPAWFIALDLIGAYLPMAWLSIQVGRRFADLIAAPTSAAPSR
jgi:hypothetical protein